jgi:hypothetical protein
MILLGVKMCPNDVFYGFWDQITPIQNKFVFYRVQNDTFPGGYRSRRINLYPYYPFARRNLAISDNIAPQKMPAVNQDLF